MQKVDDIIYITSECFGTGRTSYPEVLAELREKVCAHLKEGCVLNGGITVQEASWRLTIIQPMIKHEQTQQLETTSHLLPVRR